MTVVVDTSAVVALVFEEASSTWVARTLEGADNRVMSTATAVEFGIVYHGRNPDLPPALSVLSGLNIELVPVTTAHTQAALDGWRRFGKGRHRARLNLGGCFSYALARVAGIPLLCVGNDFSQTDLDVLTPPA